MPERARTVVYRSLAWTHPLPIVTPEQYRAIICNRCGLCCEDIVLAEAPEQLAAQIGDPATDADRRRFSSGLEFVRPVAGGWRYRCRHFHRDENGLGVCGIHETRPAICRDYPYGGMVRQWTECAWYVLVRDEAGNTVLRVDPDPAPPDGTSAGEPAH